MKLSKQHPMELVQRCLLLERIKKESPKDVYKFNRNIAIEVEYIKDGEVSYEFDWEYALFKAHSKELLTLVDKLETVSKISLKTIPDEQNN